MSIIEREQSKATSGADRPPGTRPSPGRSPQPLSPVQEDPAHVRLAPGLELHPKVYGSVLLSIAIFVASAWLAFGRDGETDYLLLIVGMVFGIFVALPTLIFLAGRSAARSGGERKAQSLEDFLESRVETGSGQLAGRQAWLQIAVIPLSLALAAILIGLATAFA